MSAGMAALMPGLARLIPEIGERYWKAYYAARAANWPMAAWQLVEMRKLLRRCEITRPKYTNDIEAWISDDVDPLTAAVDDRDLGRFERHYHEAVDAANEHSATRSRGPGGERRMRRSTLANVGASSAAESLPRDRAKVT